MEGATGVCCIVLDMVVSTKVDNEWGEEKRTR